jgi:lipoprotein-releasing system permease protein
MLIFSIAKTHLLAKKKQTLVAVLGVMFGIGMYILMISFMTGFNDFLTKNLLTATAHIRIFREVEVSKKSVLAERATQPPGGPEPMLVLHNAKPRNEPFNLHNGLGIVRVLERDPRVYAVSPQVSSQVFYNFGPSQVNGSLLGVNVLTEDLLFDLRGKVRSGNLEAMLTTQDGILMGQGLADRLNIAAGDKVTVTTPQGVTLSLKVVGTYAFGVAALDNLRSYASLQTVQKILQKDNAYITEISLKLHDLNRARRLAPQFRQQFGYKAEDWETANETILLSFVIRNALTAVVVATLLIVAAFGIYNIMSMTINEKMKDIAILKATGFSSGDIMRLFLAEAAIIGTLGGLLGLLIGFMASFALAQVPLNFGKDVALSLDRFPINFKLADYVFGLFFGILTTCLAGFFPSRKAGRIDPIAILRG